MLVKNSSFSRLIILTGHRKSGTSMFQRLFDDHSELYVYPTDIAVLYAYFPVFTKKFKNSPQDLRQRLELVLRKSIGFVQQNIVKEFSIQNYIEDVLNDLDDTALLSKEQVITSIANAWIKHYYQSDIIKPFLFKETTQSIYLNEFLEFQVPVKMISVVRDPRDNYAAIKAGVSNYYSKMNESEKESLASVINRARIDLLSASNHKEKSKEVFRAVRFEDVVNDTSKIMEELCVFLGINFQTTLLKPTELGKPYGGNSHEGHLFKGLSNKNIGAWKNRISTEEAMIIEYLIADVMETWNYSLEYNSTESEKAFSQFYNWYNSRYFYRDSFE